ncbi:MAG: thiamine pyrophosphate-dependent enzyme [Luteolibacter sp.]|uniref:thiamine pyrophosphate-dependent enzyme n=1 Tax=Luteolibacter sp. TaxID=1962973 RepID=UPI00326456A4
MIDQEHDINRTWSAESKIDLYRQMMRICRFEQAALKHYNAGKMAGFLVLNIGQQSVATGVRSLMGPDDHSISGWRGMGHALAAGMEMGPCMAELFGKTNGCSKGKSGAFSFYAPAKHHWGCHATAAAQTPLAAGLAFALKQREIKGVVFCFLGEGSVNQGVYHESLNLAGLFGLPVIYIIENNGYAMGTSVSRSSVFKDCLARRAETYGIDWDLIGDADPYEMRARIQPAIDRAREHQRPTVLEISTYRYFGSNVADANHKRYRTPEEIEEKKSRDPMMLWGLRLINEGLLDEAGLEEISRQAKAEALAAVAFAENGAPPVVSDICSDVYWETDHATESSKIGRHFFND